MANHRGRALESSAATAVRHIALCSLRSTRHTLSGGAHAVVEFGFHFGPVSVGSGHLRKSSVGDHTYRPDDLKARLILVAEHYMRAVDGLQRAGLP
jgi:hypothetical protein